MVNHKLSYDELRDMLIKQTNTLADLCLQFDKGKFNYADVIATKMGSIINFSNKDSVLPNMKKQDTMKFCSTAKVLDSTENVIVYRTLVSTAIINSEYSFFPKFNHGSYPKTWVTFDTWADTPIYVYNVAPNQTEFDGLVYIQEINDQTQFILSRKDIINFYRNKVGGAHSDAKLNKRKYYISAGIASLEYADNPSLRNISGEKYKPGEPIKYLFEMAIRQMAHELILSIKHEFDFVIMYKPLYTDYVNKRPKNLPDMLSEITTEHTNGQKEIKTLIL